MYRILTLKWHNGLQWKSCNSYNQNGFIFEEHKVLHLISLIEPFCINKECSSGLNIGLITPWSTSLSNDFALMFKFSLIFMII